MNEFPRLLVFRTFSKVYGMAGLRAGYVVGSTEASRELEAIAPPLGVNSLTQVAVEHALTHGDGEVDRRRNLVIEQRKRDPGRAPGPARGRPPEPGQLRVAVLHRA